MELDSDDVMGKEEAKSKWDDLARQLGAEVPPEAAPPEGPPASSTPASPPQPAKAAKRPPAPKSAGWDDLASSFGLASTPVPPAETPAKSPPPPKPRPAIAKPAPPPVVASEPTTEPAAAAPLPPKPVPPKPAPTEAKGEMSLWHRIFGSPEQQTKKISEKSTGGEPTEHEGKGEAARSEEPPIYSGDVVEKTSAVVDVAFEEPIAREDAGEPGSEEEGQPRRRRPRRRRRGRGGRKSDEASDREKPAPRGGDRPAESEQKAGPPRHAAPDDLDLDDEDEEDDDLDDNFLDEDESDEDGDGDTGERSSSGRVIPPSHRNMPTWEEAIGVIVETNLQTRSERKRSPRPSSQGGSSRGGRSRGGRRKKSP